ncbi:M15 family metallopeptidase [Parablautia muri]|uniref:D-alanyl-D-alanine carboxypeptidase family protein n=1 Tax=Parablautia muri TaxID=2320879 RepID=A0A9X5GSP0_9FIRM|nr:M15 family metallopeptidase [Parablautia muri]NBJ92127.1 D-alanyl-D-alanine carboxypeptidase family protein [Parablautia muri]
MERESYNKLIRYFINMGKRSKFWKIPALAGLAVSMFTYRLYEHGRKKTMRFACVVFILSCFVIANSFAFPVFHEEGGFVSAKEMEMADTEDTFGNLDKGAFYGIKEEHTELSDGLFDGNFSLSKDIEDKDENEKDSLKQEEEKEQIVFDREDWKLMLINKLHPIPLDYSFTLGPIKTMKGTMKCDERIIEDLLFMMQGAKEDGINLAICSPYRDMNRQKALFNRKIKAYMDKDMTYMEAYKLASQIVTVPGASEHEVGLAVDIVADTYLNLDEGFAETEAGIWLEEHCAEYGFILRYPKGKEYITSIEFEPWHFRYVGKEAAKVIMEEELCLEEFWEKYL